MKLEWRMGQDGDTITGYKYWTLVMEIPSIHGWQVLGAGLELVDRGVVERGE